MSVKWQTTQYCVVCQYKNGKQSEEYCVEQVISFQQQTNTEKVFDEVVYPEELTLKKMDHVADTVWQNWSPNRKRFNQITKSLSKSYRIEICHLYRS